MQALVELDGVAKRYLLAGREIPVLHDLDFAARRGEFVAITGRSGSGKSTLLHILGGLDRPSSGSYRFAGREMAALDDDERSRIRNARIGFVFQSFHLLPQLTVAQNVALPFAYAPQAPRDVGARAAAALERVGLSHRAAHRPAELSGGEMQRAAIARAMVGEPDLLLADEPTGNLDAATGAQVLDALEALNAAGTAIVLVTHDAEVAARAGRRCRLTGGRLDG
jgi:putative ABC transport system ATP-binding protein